MTVALGESTVPSIGRGLRRRPGRCSSPASSLQTGSRRHRISTVFQILGRRADSLRMGLYTNFLDTTGVCAQTSRQIVLSLFRFPTYNSSIFVPAPKNLTQRHPQSTSFGLFGARRIMFASGRRQHQYKPPPHCQPNPKSAHYLTNWGTQFPKSQHQLCRTKHTKTNDGQYSTGHRKLIKAA